MPIDNHAKNYVHRPRISTLEAEYIYIPNERQDALCLLGYMIYAMGTPERKNHPKMMGVIMLLYMGA